MNLNLRFVVTTCLLAGTGIFLQARHGQEIIAPRPVFTTFPRQLGIWTGTDVPIPGEVAAVLGPGDFLSRIYQDGLVSDAPIDLFMAYFPSQRAGDTIHSPRNCLPGSGWRPIESGQTILSIPGQEPFTANRYVIAKGADRRLVLYWYQAHNRAVASEYWAKFYLIADSIRINRSDGSLIRITTPLRADESADSKQLQLIAFTEKLAPQIDVYVPR